MYLAASSVWSAETFPANIRRALAEDLVENTGEQLLDLGCCLAHGAFEHTEDGVRVSCPEESLIFFILRLLDRLRAMGTAPAADWMEYCQALRSFREE